MGYFIKNCETLGTFGFWNDKWLDKGGFRAFKEQNHPTDSSQICAYSDATLSFPNLL